MSHAPCPLAHSLPAPRDSHLTAGRKTVTLVVANTGDRPVQVGAHFHFAETNGTLDFDRAAARGMRLDIAAGSTVLFAPGQRRDVRLIPVGGLRQIRARQTRASAAG